MELNLGLRIALIIVGLSALAFGIATGFSHGWQLDIVNTITMVAGVGLIAVGILAKTSDTESKSTHSQHL